MLNIINKKSMKIIFTFLLAIMAVSVSGQSFEGKIVYQNAYLSKIPNVSDHQFTSMMGSSQDYFIKDGDYKSTSNGAMFEWQLYVNKENRLYSKLSNSETVFWNDGAINPDEVLNVEVNRNVTEILGYICDEVILTCESGIQKYYFNSNIGVDASLFTGHIFGNWYDYIKVAEGLPLKSIIDNAQFSLVSVATEINRVKLNSQDFQLPDNLRIEKSPY